MKQKLLPAVFALGLGLSAAAQVNSGSNGSDGPLDYSSLTNLGYATNIVINLADHPTGIYQYTYVNIPANVTVTFIPNANNTPVYWLVQSNVVINGTVDVSGQAGSGNGIGGSGGPGGYIGGGGGTTPAPPGQGPGGGSWGTWGMNANYNYGNIYLVPLLGGSGGGGGYSSAGGGGGGGAVLIAASGQFFLAGQLIANGGAGVAEYRNPGPSAVGGGGSGGAVRIIATKITGFGVISAAGGSSLYQNGSGGQGRVRFDTYQNNFSGNISGAYTEGFQPIIFPTAGQGAQLTVTSIGGVPVSASPTGQLATPDAVLSAQQNNPIPVVVSCANLPLNTQITVSVAPANGPPVSATGLNSTGTVAASTATVLVVMPRGGGLIYATAATGN